MTCTKERGVQVTRIEHPMIQLTSYHVHIVQRLCRIEDQRSVAWDQRRRIVPQ